MVKKITILIFSIAACSIPCADISARGGRGGGHGGFRGGGHGFRGGGHGWHGGHGFRGRGWGGRGWGRGYWGGWRGRGWGWGGWGLGLGWGLGWPYGRGYWGYPWYGYGYPYGYPAYPPYAITPPVQTPTNQIQTTQPAGQVQQQAPDGARDSAGQSFWTMSNQTAFPLKIATDREVISLNPGEQKMVNRGFDFTFTAEGGGVSRQFSSRDHTITLDPASFGLQQMPPENYPTNTERMAPEKG